MCLIIGLKKLVAISKVLFTSDLHFGHKWVAQDRNFHDEFYHDEKIIENWNKVVNKRDIVYILGDITMESNFWYYQLDRLNGTKRVVLGNHDMQRDVPELLKYVEYVSGVIKYKGFMCTHIPIHHKELYDNNYKTKWRGNLHGHMHRFIINDSMYYNVGLDANNMTPIAFEEILNKLKSQEN